MKLDPNEFDEVLAKALKRVNAPPDLENFLMKATEAEAERKLPWRERKHRWVFVMPRMPVWAGTALAAVLVVGAFVSERVHVEHVRKAAAVQEFDTATRITNKALEHAREQMQRAGISLDE